MTASFARPSSSVFREAGARAPCPRAAAAGGRHRGTVRRERRIASRPAADPAAHPPSSDRLLLPAPDELIQGHVVDLDHLVPHTGDIPVRPSHAAADALDEDLVVLADEVDRTVPDREGRDLTAVLD